jgi:hypothetical protein
MSDENIQKYKEARRNVKERYERSKGTDIRGVVSKIRYER